MTEKNTDKQRYKALPALFLGTVLSFGGYTSWTTHLSNMDTTWNKPLLSVVVGLSLNALGAAVILLLAKYAKKFALGKSLTFFLLLAHFFFLIPVFYSKTITGTFFYGFLMCLTGGAVAAIALYDFAVRAGKNREFSFAAVFAASIFLIRILEPLRIGRRRFFISSVAIVLYLATGVVYFLLLSDREEAKKEERKRRMEI